MADGLLFCANVPFLRLVYLLYLGFKDEFQAIGLSVRSENSVSDLTQDPFSKENIIREEIVQALLNENYDQYILLCKEVVIQRLSLSSVVNTPLNEHVKIEMPYNSYSLPFSDSLRIQNEQDKQALSVGKFSTHLDHKHMITLGFEGIENETLERSALHQKKNRLIAVAKKMICILTRSVGIAYLSRSTEDDDYNQPIDGAIDLYDKWTQEKYVFRRHYSDLETVLKKSLFTGINKNMLESSLYGKKLLKAIDHFKDKDLIVVEEMEENILISLKHQDTEHCELWWFNEDKFMSAQDERLAWLRAHQTKNE
jgi:hypothetical protein